MPSDEKAEAEEREVRAHFKVRSRLQQAFDDRRAAGEEVRVWAYETPTGFHGGRRFFAAGVEQFFAFYATTRAGRHFDELIAEHTPCRPYFDLEFYRVQNPGVDGRQLVADFVETCAFVFKDACGLDVAASDFLLLDSSTAEKFSAHAIVHLPDGRLFPDNLALKPLLQAVCAELDARGRCLVRKKNGVRGFFVDHVMYTPNRLFRLVLSAKAHSEAVFRVADYCRFYGADGPPDQRRLFLDALVVPHRYWEHPVLDLEELELV
ncbi:DNA-directed primase/polymerase protein [Aphelenchoides fujianensis]|nr:DNA-directed primase/polymerase protein [Aphelenchoides fujianensis]KAI6239714.1 DNA-directed primase/polymerase protein [Aphelenchoides fujianensis]